MEITKPQFKIIEHLLPAQRGNVKIPNIQVINAILYIAEHGCKWRGLPKSLATDTVTVLIFVLIVGLKKVF